MARHYKKDLKKIKCDSVEWNHLAYDVLWWTPVNMLTKLCVLQAAGIS